MKDKDFLSIRTLSTDELRDLLELGFAIKAEPSKYSDSLKGKALAMIFEKPSLRTRVSFEVGIHQLGGFAVHLSPAEISLGKRESVPDVARNLERMVQGIMIRTFAHSIVEDMAEHASIPVINGLTDFSHPCQAVADYMTILESKGTLHGTKIAYVGDGNNVANSLMFGAARLGVHLVVAAPPGYEPAREVTSWARANSEASGARIEVTNDPVSAVTDADVVYTDVWASMGREAEAQERRDIFRPFQVNEALFARAASDAVFMHCLPAHRGEEVADGVIDSERAVVYQQAENRLHAQKAIMVSVMA